MLYSHWISTDSLQVPLVLRASKVPSSRIGRLLHYGCELVILLYDVSAKRS